MKNKVLCDDCAAVPQQCPICGEGLLGGGNTSRYYKCGGTFWVRRDDVLEDIVMFQGRCGKDYTKDPT